MTTQKLAPDIAGIFSNVQKIPRNTKPLDLKDSFIFDFNTGDFVLHGGALTLASQSENVRMWIRKTLITEQGIFAIYGKGYGSQINSLIGKGYVVELLQVMFADIIKDAIGSNPSIRTIDKFKVSVTDNSLTANFRVTLVNTESISLEQSWVIG